MHSFGHDDPATAAAIDARHKTRYLWQMILRTVINLMACTVFSLSVFCWVKFDIVFKVTLAVVSSLSLA